SRYSRGLRRSQRQAIQDLDAEGQRPLGDLAVGIRGSRRRRLGQAPLEGSPDRGQVGGRGGHRAGPIADLEQEVAAVVFGQGGDVEAQRVVEHAGEVKASQAIGRGRGGDAPPNLFVDVGRVLVLEVAQVEPLEVYLATVDLDRLDRGRAGRVGQGDDEHEAVAGLGRVERDAFGDARVGGSADSSPT